MTNVNFESLGLAPFFAARLEERNIRSATDIQKKAIPVLLEGQSLVFRSATGTGKTLAYLLPALQRLPAQRGETGVAPSAGRPLHYSGPSLLVCAPTFELCAQIKNEIDFLLAPGDGNAAEGAASAERPQPPVSALLLIGSASLNRQIDSLKKSRPSIVVGNPGRLLVLAKMGKLKLGGIRFLALDEADRLCAEESIEETAELLRLIAHNGRGKDGMPLSGLTVTACSATVSAKTKESLGPLFADAPLLETDEQEILRERIEHWAIFSENRRRIITLRSLLSAVQTKKARARILVFAGRNDEAGKALSQLQRRHIAAAGLFGKMGRQERKAALDSFRAGKTNVLVSSDLAARGLDIPGITHVIALDVPADKEAYIHRAGRTGRAGKHGVMASIGDEQEMRRLAGLEKKLGIVIHPKELYNGTVCAPSENL